MQSSNKNFKIRAAALLSKKHLHVTVKLYNINIIKYLASPGGRLDHHENASRILGSKT